MDIYINGSFIKTTNLEGLITLVDEFHCEKTPLTMRVETKNKSIEFDANTIKGFLVGKDSFLLKVINAITEEDLKEEKSSSNKLLILLFTS